MFGGAALRGNTFPRKASGQHAEMPSVWQTAAARYRATTRRQ
jgi:hypothetical protein